MHWISVSTSTWGPHGAPPRMGTMGLKDLPWPFIFAKKKPAPSLTPIIPIWGPQVKRCTVYLDVRAIVPTVYSTLDGCKGGVHTKFRRGVFVWSIRIYHQVGPTPGAQDVHKAHLITNVCIYIYREILKNAIL